MIAKHLTLCAVFALAATSCSRPAPAGPKAQPATRSVKGAPPSSNAAFGLPAVVPKLRFMPDVEGSRGVAFRTEEGELSLVSRMRMRVSSTGVTERANELLPQGRIVAQRVPARLGGGFLFLAATGRGSELWRSDTWLGPLQPLVALGPTAHKDRPLSMGFDRFYLRTNTNELVALEPQSGGVVSLGPLPVAPAYGDMAFLDGWRAVVDTDFAGTLATFDAGATWRRINSSARVRAITPSSPNPDDGETAVVQVDGGVYRVTPDGHVSFSAAPTAPMQFATPPPDPRSKDPAKPASKPPGRLGKKPLRVALERGYPDSDSTALVAWEGALVRVSLETGAIIGVTEHAYPDTHADCSGIALGSAHAKRESSIGFVCGSALGATTIYALEPPLKLREVMRFSKPRVVTESGQGAIVVFGPCSDEAQPGGARPFCVRFADGTSREVRIRGEVGAERVIALDDGRVVILVPPRVGTQGQISILSGKSSKHILLKMPDIPAPREIETGMWLEGFHQSAKDEISGWVEAGGPMFGVRIKLDGSLSVGEIRDDSGGVLVGGRFGLAIGESGHMLETSDTGFSWREVDVPRVDEPSDALRSRRCSAIGCVLPGWLKIGWGDTAHEGDLEEAPAPAPVKLASMKLSSQPLSLSCRTARSEPKAKASGKKNQGTTITGWLPLRSVDAPAMQSGEVGLDNGGPFETVPLRAYVWGKKDSDWTRTGRFVVRYVDKFALEEVRSTAITASPWASEALASDAFGVGTYGYTNLQWGAQRDHDSALVGACRGRICSLFSAEPEEPVLTLRTTEAGGLAKPLFNGAVKVDKSWFYLGDVGIPDQVGLYRADLGHVRLVTTLRRLSTQSFSLAAMPRLVRRSSGGGLGLLFTLREGPTDRRGMRWVLPVDPDTGDLGEPARIGRPDFGDMEVSASCGERDGWVAEVAIDPSPFAVVDGNDVSLETTELRVRLEEGHACVEAGASSVAFGFRADDKKARALKGETKVTSGGFAMMATDRSNAQRRELVCDTKAKN